jgi:uncharacterized membrane protein (UPF0127 family)
MLKRKSVLFISFLFCIFLIFVVILSTITYTGTVTIHGKTYSVEIADTKHLQDKGLSGHDPLKDNQGMLFVFKTPDTYGFWMKDMGFPLDIVWIDENFKIVHLESSVTPDTYNKNPPKIFFPAKPALYVLEISENEISTLGIKVGDEVKITKKWL